MLPVLKRMHKNTRLMLILCAVALAMLGVGFGFVPLYRKFCQAFGIPVPKVLSQADASKPHPEIVSNRTVTVRFVGNQGGGIPVELAPLTYTMRARLGQPLLTAYQATNNSARDLDGVAVHMVYGMGGAAGDDMLPYIDLQQCFCFESQHYPAHRQVTLPLSFVIRPDLPADIHTVTFSYTLFQQLPNDPRIRKKRPA